MWYVIQVVGGREESVLQLIRKYADANTYTEVFVPRYRAAKHTGGAWEYSFPVLTPGYVIVDTHDVTVFEAQLHRIPQFTRLLGDNSGFKPLDRQEMAWLQQWTQRGERVMQGSTGRIKKGKLRILSGPLVGREADVIRVNRRKHQAVVRLTMMGREKEITLEFELLGKSDE